MVLRQHRSREWSYHERSTPDGRGFDSPQLHQIVVTGHTGDHNVWQHSRCLYWRHHYGHIIELSTVKGNSISATLVVGAYESRTKNTTLYSPLGRSGVGLAFMNN